MIKTALNCPNCGAKYNPAKMRCEFCGSFVVFPKEKMFTIPDDIVAEMKAAVQQPDTNASKEQLGIYIFGSLLEKGEVPLRLGSANYNKTRGKLLLTEKNLYFLSNKFAQGKTDVCIPLTSILSIQQIGNLGISQTIAALTNEKQYSFVVYHGKEWVKTIENAKSGKTVSAKTSTVNQQTNDYTDELRKLKELLDAGIITEDEFAVKKRQILNI